QASRVSTTYRTSSSLGETQLTTATYDNAGRPQTLSEYASGASRTTTYGYDTTGRLQTTTRPNGVVTTDTYDPNQGTVATISHKQGGTTELSPWTYSRSSAGRITTETTTAGGGGGSTGVRAAPAGANLLDTTL